MAIEGSIDKGQYIVSRGFWIIALSLSTLLFSFCSQSVLLQLFMHQHTPPFAPRWIPGPTMCSWQNAGFALRWPTMCTISSITLSLPITVSWWPTYVKCGATQLMRPTLLLKRHGIILILTATIRWSSCLQSYGCFWTTWVVVSFSVIIPMETVVKMYWRLYARKTRESHHLRGPLSANLWMMLRLFCTTTLSLLCYAWCQIKVCICSLVMEGCDLILEHLEGNGKKVGAYPLV